MYIECLHNKWMAAYLRTYINKQFKVVCNSWKLLNVVVVVVMQQMKDSCEVGLWLAYIIQRKTNIAQWCKV